MRQKYEVHINGKPFVIGGTPDPRAVPARWLAVQVDAEQELAPLVRLLTDRPEVAGVVAHGDAERIWDWFRAGYRFVQAAGGAVSDERGRLLVIHRLGLWDLPKGKVEAGEPIDVGAVREVQEECGLQEVTLVAPLCETWHTYERKGEQHLKRTDWFLMRASSTEVLTAQEEEDIDAVRWADPEELAAIKRDTYPSLLAVFTAWEARRGPGGPDVAPRP